MKYKTGQIWEDNDRCEHKILGVCDNIVFVSWIDNFERSHDPKTEHEADMFLIKLVEEKWVPEKGDDYWLINSEGTIVSSYYENDSTDEFRLSVGNIYKTKEEAEAYKHKLINLNK